MKRAKKRAWIWPEFVIFLHSQCTVSELTQPAAPLPDGVKLFDGYLVNIPGIRFIETAGAGNGR